MKISQAVDLIEMLHDAPLSRVSDCLRSFLVAASGKRLICADFANIEGRVNAWLSKQDDKVELFRQNGPIYERMGATIFDTTVDAVVAKGKDCEERDLGKRAELGCFAAETPVLTYNGVKPIVDVTTADLVWDGAEWVEHRGLICRGAKDTILLAGVRVTPDHLMWSGSRWRPAADLARNASIRSQALATASANLPSQGTEWVRGAALAVSSSNVRAGGTNTALRSTPSERGRQRGAMSVRKRRRSVGKRSIGVTQTYDLAFAGPRNRFTIFSNDGPLIAHNCGFGMGWRKFQGTAKKEANLRLSDDLSKKSIKAWRALNDKIVLSWRAYEEAAVGAVLRPGNAFQAGDTPIRYKQSGSFLFCQLPSGRALTYPYPRLQPRAWITFEDETTRAVFGVNDDEIRRKADKIAADEGLVIKDIRAGGHALTFKGVNSVTRRWERQSAYGGLLCENVVQATARDMLAEAMVRVEAAGYPVILHVHDELVAEVDEDFGDLDEFKGLMAEVPTWATGCPIAAEGWVGKRYRK